MATVAQPTVTETEQQKGAVAAPWEWDRAFSLARPQPQHVPLRVTVHRPSGGGGAAEWRIETKRPRARVMRIDVQPNGAGCANCRAELHRVADLPPSWRNTFDPLQFAWVVRKTGPCDCGGACLDVTAHGVVDGPGTPDVLVARLVGPGQWLLDTTDPPREITAIRTRPGPTGCELCRPVLYANEASIAKLPLDWACGRGPTDDHPLRPTRFGWQIRKAGPCSCSDACLDIEATCRYADFPEDYERITVRGREIAFVDGVAGPVRV